MYWVTGVLGFVLAAAPFLFGYEADTTAMWTSLVIGGVVMLASVIEGIRNDTDRWEYWVAAILGVGAALAPFVFNFSNNTSAVTTSVILGFIIALVAGSKLTSKAES